MATITREMIDILNSHLATSGSAWRIIPRTDYQNVDYDATIKVTNVAPIRSPFLVDQTQYTNCTHAVQTITDTIAKSLETTATWSVTAGLKVGIEAKVGVNVIFAKAETTITAELSLEAGYSESTTNKTLIQSEINLTINPMTRVVRQVLVEQQEAADIPFVANIVLRSGTFSFQPASTAALYRYYNADTGDHFYTTDRTGLGDGRDGYLLERVEAQVFPTPVAATLPLHRYYNAANGDHFYTTDRSALGDGRDGYRYERIEGYVYASQQPGTIALHRYYNGVDHFYTTELGGGRDGYHYEQVACFVPSTEAQMDILAVLPDAAQRAFQSQGTFSGKAVDRRVQILAQESPVDAATCALLGKDAAVRGKVKGLYAQPAASTTGLKLLRVHGKGVHTLHAK